MKPVGTNQQGKEAGTINEKAAGFCSKTFRLLFHEDVYYRIGGLLIFGLLLFLITWAVCIFLVDSPNMMQNSMVVKKFFKSEILRSIGPWGSKTFGETWKVFSWNIDVSKEFGVWGNVLWLTLKYFLNHLVFVVFFIFLLNLFKVGRWNLGLIYFALYTILWGITAGTNSMGYPVGNNVVWGTLVLFARYGLWTWFAYLLLVAATAYTTWFTAPAWTSWNWERVRAFKEWKFNPDQKEVFIYGLLFLLAASFAEARIFVHYNF